MTNYYLITDWEVSCKTDEELTLYELSQELNRLIRSGIYVGEMEVWICNNSINDTPLIFVTKIKASQYQSALPDKLENEKIVATRLS